MNDYTYDEYLQEWSKNFGEAEYGDFAYYHHGKSREKWMKRMTEAEFYAAVALVHSANTEISSLLAMEDSEAVSERIRMLFEQTFPYELALFY